MTTVSYARAGKIFVDAHVHIHPCFALTDFFSAAQRNFDKAAGESGPAEKHAFVLSLTETQRADYFSTLAAIADSQDNTLEDRFRVCRTDEQCSLIVESLDEKNDLILIAGRQIVTSERLEVLALCTGHRFEDGEPIGNVLEKVAAARALAVIPWGFGKWYGRRGRILDDVLKRARSGELCLGDNSGRPALMPEPKQFRVARQKGIPILPGSDPLPFASESWRPGSFGYRISGTLNRQTPAADLLRIFADNELDIKTYGRLENPFRFLRNQFAMQFAKGKC